MSQENVELVHRFFERWTAGNWDGLEELVDKGVEEHGAVGGIEEGRVLRGLDEIRRSYEAVEQEWDEHRVEPQEFVDRDDRVVVLLREYQRGKRSGIELVIDTAAVFGLRDGRITRIQGYMVQAEALKAVGLEE